MNIDPGVITLIQTNFLQKLNNIFDLTARYAFNLLYIFATLELSICGIIYALHKNIEWSNLFTKILKIGLFIFTIQNYPTILQVIINSFAQIAGIAINNSKISSFIFEPQNIYKYGYDTGLFLLHQASLQNNNIGFSLVLIALGIGLLLVFGFLAIKVIVQIVGFYLTSLTALIISPLGVLNGNSRILDKALQSVIQAGVRVMVIIIIVGVAINIWDQYNLSNMSKNLVNIAQPLGLFFSALLFLSFIVYLPNIAANAIGEINSSFDYKNCQSSSIPNAGRANLHDGINAIKSATTISDNGHKLANGTQLGSTDFAKINIEHGQNSASGSQFSRNFLLNQNNKINKWLSHQAREIQHNISKQATKELKEILLQSFNEKKISSR